MKLNIFKTAVAAVVLSCAASAMANPRQAILIGYPTVDGIDNFQEYAAAKFFVDNNKDGVVIAPGETDKIDAKNLDCIWIHIDRLEVGKGNLPSAFSDAATVEALKKFLADGGNLLLTKHATQLLAKIGRVEPSFDINIYSDGQGGEGFDDWTLNAYLGYWQENPDNQGDKFPEQIYDRRGHDIYKGLETSDAFAWETFPMEGTGNIETSLWREDHNCMWDLNGYTYTAEGANTVEKFENQTNSVILGTWGHVQDYAVAGVVEFLPADNSGRIIANGLATCEWSPRNGVNAYHSNLEKLTQNCLSYLAPASTDGVADIEVADDAAAEYFNLQGVCVDAEALAPGLYIVRRGNNATKVLVK